MKNHEHEYRKGRGNVDVCICGRFRFNEKAGEPVVCVPSDMKSKLIAKGYGEESANFLTSSYYQFPTDRTKWGTEEQTRKDIESILGI